MPRPYVAPRPRCRYYDTSRGCFANDKCRYLHGDPAVQKYAPYEENKTCRFYAQGYCKRGNDCWFRHVDAGGSPDVGAGADVGVEMRETEAESAESDPACSICFEDKPALYGLLSGCSHAFCLNCIRKWREPEGKGVEMTDSRIHKTCPMCRVSTKFIVPSSRFYAQDSPHKADVIAKYKQSMARVPCRYFVHSKPGNRFCPFGRDCFYRHANADGTPYEFPHGVDVMMSIWPRHRRREVLGSLTQNPHLDGPLQAALEVLEGFAETLATENDGTTSSDTHRLPMDMHMRDMMESMGHHPAMRMLAQLERMMAPDEPEQSPSPSTTEPLAAAEEDDDDDFLPSLVPLPPSPLPLSPTSSELSLEGGAGAGTDPDPAAPEFPSQDPRAPHNTSASSPLTAGDFAWMM